jgi:cytochrome P450
MPALTSLSNLTDFMADPLRFMRELALGKDIVTIRLGHKRFVFANTADAAQEILLKKAATFVQNRNVFDRIQPVTGEKGLVQLQGKESQEARAKSRSMFSGANMDSARAITSQFTNELVQQLSVEREFEPTQKMTPLILRTALKILLGIDSEELTAKIGGKFLRLNYLCGLRMRSLIPMPLLVPTFKNREIRSLQTELRTLIAKEIAKGHEGGVPKAFAGDPNLLDHCITFLFAGHETTASSLAFTLLLLAQNPEHQEDIAAGNEELTLAVYKESLRLYPPAYMLAREASDSDSLCGRRIQKGDQVILSISELHRNEEYFEEPDFFRPERFLKNPIPFSYLPFGAGAKSCVGERLAYVEATVVLQLICQNFQLSTHEEEISVEPLITLHPLPGQMIQLKVRSPQ